MARPALYNTILCCALSESEIWESPSLRTEPPAPIVLVFEQWWWTSGTSTNDITIFAFICYYSAIVQSTHPPTKQHGCFQHCPGIIHKCNYFLDNGDWDWSRRRDIEVRAAG